MFTQRLRTEFVTVWVDDTRRLVKFKRSSRSFPTVEALRDSVNDLIGKLYELVPLESQPEYGLFQDMRDAPLVRNPEMDRVLNELAPRMSSHFRKVAILIQTPVGLLQARRKAAEINLKMQVFEDEIEALNFLTAL